MTRIICHGDYPCELNKIYVDEIKSPDGNYKRCSFRIIRETTIEEYIEFVKNINGYDKNKNVARYIYEVEILD